MVLSTGCARVTASREQQWSIVQVAALNKGAILSDSVRAISASIACFSGAESCAAFGTACPHAGDHSNTTRSITEVSDPARIPFLPSVSERECQ